MNSAEHRRPLAAFVVVFAVACLIMGQGLRDRVVEVLSGSGTPRALITAIAPDMVLSPSLDGVPKAPVKVRAAASPEVPGSSSERGNLDGALLETANQAAVPISSAPAGRPKADSASHSGHHHVSTVMPAAASAADPAAPVAPPVPVKVPTTPATPPTSTTPVGDFAGGKDPQQAPRPPRHALMQTPGQTRLWGSHHLRHQVRGLVVAVRVEKPRAAPGHVRNQWQTRNGDRNHQGRQDRGNDRGNHQGNDRSHTQEAGASHDRGLADGPGRSRHGH